MEKKHYPPVATRVCIFCGSTRGTTTAYTEHASALGRFLAQSGLGVVYGGAHVGLMAAVADAALAAGGEVTGVIPQALVDRELAHSGLTTLYIVSSMHERKALMAKLSSAFVALPGGFGTLDEFCEILTWAQLGIHDKPCILFNTEGYWTGFLHFLDHAVLQGFITPSNRALVQVAEDIPTLMAMLPHPVN